MVRFVSVVPNTINLIWLGRWHIYVLFLDGTIRTYGPYNLMILGFNASATVWFVV